MKTTLVITKLAADSLQALPIYIRRDAFLRSFSVLPANASCTIKVQRRRKMSQKNLLMSAHINCLCAEFTATCLEFADDLS